MNHIESKIFVVRGKRVLLDFDLALLYGVPTGHLNQQVKRNGDRFPDDFCFSLTNPEVASLRSQNVISSQGWGGRPGTMVNFVPCSRPFGTSSPVIRSPEDGLSAWIHPVTSNTAWA
jgi:hypothetical protein